MGKRSVSAWQSVKTFIKFKTDITFIQVASSPSIRSIKSSIVIFVNIFFLIFIVDLVRKNYAEPKPYIMYMYVTERSENTLGRVDSGRVDPVPSWPATVLDGRSGLLCKF